MNKFEGFLEELRLRDFGNRLSSTELVLVSTIDSIINNEFCEITKNKCFSQSYDSASLHAEKMIKAKSLKSSCRRFVKSWFELAFCTNFLTSITEENDQYLDYKLSFSNAINLFDLESTFEKTGALVEEYGKKFGFKYKWWFDDISSKSSKLSQTLILLKGLVKKPDTIIPLANGATFSGLMLKSFLPETVLHPVRASCSKEYQKELLIDEKERRVIKNYDDVLVFNEDVCSGKSFMLIIKELDPLHRVRFLCNCLNWDRFKENEFPEPVFYAEKI